MAAKDKDILSEALEAFRLDVQHEQVNRDEAADDLKFRAGEQWPLQLQQERVSARRPLLTINRMPQFVRQVTGDLRQNRPSIKVRPVDEEADPEIAKTYTGLIRHIEYVSDAQAAYITAAEHAATCGMGHFRILTDYCSDEGFEQEILIKRIHNPFAVTWDAAAREITREDAGHCFVSKLIARKAYEALYPGKTVSDFSEPTVDPTAALNWVQGDLVRVAEYWKRISVSRKLHQLSDDTTAYEDDMEEVKKDRPDVSVKRSRDVDDQQVCFWKISANDILEPRQEWAGKYIPIIPVIGEEIDIGERVVRHGIVRFAKDPQRLYNFSRTAAAEQIALAPKQPFLVTEKQIQGREAQWAQANSSNLPYLVFTPDQQQPGVPARSRPADPPSALWEEVKIAEQDMYGTTGIYPPSLGQKSNEVSGRAILAREKQGDTGTFVYADNLARAIRHAGSIIVDLIPKVYDTTRVVRIVGEDDSEGWARINEPMTGQDGQPAYGTVVKFPGKADQQMLGDFTTGQYDVTISTGPSYSTKRAESADQLLALVQSVPVVGEIAPDLIVKALDLVDGDALTDRLKKLPQVAAVTPPDPNSPPPPPPPPPPPDPKLIQAQMAPQLKQMDATLQVILQHMKNASAIEVARVNKGDDDGLRAYEAEMGAAVQAYGHATSAQADMHGATLDHAAQVHDTNTTADTARRTAAMGNLTTTHNASQDRAAAAANPNPQQ